PLTIYWTYPCSVRPFGPFICRTHFPFYVNICLGLGLGLLLGRESSRGTGHWTGAESWRDWLQSPLKLLHHPRALWLSIAAALMVSGVLFSLSRGGFLALLAATFVCLAIRLSGSGRFVRLR